MVNALSHTVPANTSNYGKPEHHVNNKGKGKLEQDPNKAEVFIFDRDFSGNVTMDGDTKDTFNFEMDPKTQNKQAELTETILPNGSTQYKTDKGGVITVNGKPPGSMGGAFTDGPAPVWPDAARKDATPDGKILNVEG